MKNEHSYHSERTRHGAMHATWGVRAGVNGLFLLICAAAAALSASGVSEAEPARPEPRVVLIIDQSSSMSEGRKDACTIAAAQLLLAMLPDETTVGLLGFDTDARDLAKGLVRLRDPGARERLRDTIDGLGFRGRSTNYLPPLQMAATLAGNAQTDADMVVFLSDGGHNEDSVSDEQVRQAARTIQGNKVRLETIFLGADKAADRERMIELAGAGGKFHDVPGSAPERLADVMLEILGDWGNYVDAGSSPLPRDVVPSAASTQVLFVAVPPGRTGLHLFRPAQDLRVLRNGQAAAADGPGVYTYPNGLKGSRELKILSVSAPEVGVAWHMEATQLPEKWNVRVLERRGLRFDFVKDRPRTAYWRLPDGQLTEPLDIAVHVPGSAGRHASQMLDELPDLEVRAAVTVQTGTVMEDFRQLPPARWVSMRVVAGPSGDATLLLPGDQAFPSTLLPKAASALANYSCVVSVRFGSDSQHRGEIVKQKSFKVLGAPLSVPAAVEIPPVLRGAAPQPAEARFRLLPGVRRARLAVRLVPADGRVAATALAESNVGLAWVRGNERVQDGQESVLRIAPASADFACARHAAVLEVTPGEIEWDAEEGMQTPAGQGGQAFSFRVPVTWLIEPRAVRLRDVDLGTVRCGTVSEPKTLDMAANWRVPCDCRLEVSDLRPESAGSAPSVPIPAGCVKLSAAALPWPGAVAPEVRVEAPLLRAGRYAGTLSVVAQATGELLGKCTISLALEPARLRVAPAAVDFGNVVASGPTDPVVLSIESPCLADTPCDVVFIQEMVSASGEAISPKRVQLALSSKTCRVGSPLRATVRLSLEPERRLLADGVAETRVLKAGLYEGRLRVAAPGFAECLIPVRATVEPLRLWLEPGTSPVDLGKVDPGAERSAHFELRTNSRVPVAVETSITEELKPGGGQGRFVLKASPQTVSASQRGGIDIKVRGGAPGENLPTAAVCNAMWREDKSGQATVHLMARDPLRKILIVPETIRFARALRSGSREDSSPATITNRGEVAGEIELQLDDFHTPAGKRLPRMYFALALREHDAESGRSAKAVLQPGQEVELRVRADIPPDVGQDTHASTGTSGEYTATISVLLDGKKAGTIAVVADVKAGQ